jgi:hypothetical protein
MKIGTLLLALPMALIGGAVMAKITVPPGAVVYLCEMASQDNLSPDKVAVIRDPKTNEIQVFDGVIKTVYAAPIKAEIIGDTPARLDLNWTVKGLPLNGATVHGTVFYGLTMMKATLDATERVVLAGYDNKENGKGTCKLLK